MSLVIPVVPVVPVVLVNILNVLFLQFENWTFCETEWEPYNSSGNPTQCQTKRADYIDGGRKGVSEKVLEIQFNITSYGKKDICNVNCSCKNEDSTANCRFGNAYSVTYFETVSGVFDQTLLSSRNGLALITTSLFLNRLLIFHLFLFGLITSLTKAAFLRI